MLWNSTIQTMKQCFWVKHSKIKTNRNYSCQGLGIQMHGISSFCALSMACLLPSILYLLYIHYLHLPFNSSPLSNLFSVGSQNVPRKFFKFYSSCIWVLYVMHPRTVLFMADIARPLPRSMEFIYIIKQNSKKWVIINSTFQVILPAPFRVVDYNWYLPTGIMKIAAALMCILKVGSPFM
jgi:hypothetical protein